MTITGTYFNYYQLCRRKLWLFANGINMEQESDLVYEGKLVHESSYPQRISKYEEVEIDGVKVDYYDTKNKVIHEIKKLSDTLAEAKAIDEIMGIEGNIRLSASFMLLEKGVILCVWIYLRFSNP